LQDENTILQSDSVLTKVSHGKALKSIIEAHNFLPCNLINIPASMVWIFSKHNNVFFDFSISKLIPSAKEFDLTSNIVNRYIQDHYINCLGVYVDGAYKEGRGGAAAACIPSLYICFSEAISSYNSPLTAELYAILNALVIIKSLCISTKQISIFCDSAQALYAIKASYPKKHANIVYSIWELFQELGNLELYLVWIPAHFDVSGNIIADSLAKEKLYSFKYPFTQSLTESYNEFSNDHNYVIPYPFPSGHRFSIIDVESILRAISISMLITWKSNWALSQKSRQHYLLQPDPRVKWSFTPKNRRQQTLLHQLRINSSKLNMSLHKIKAHSSGLCSLCKVPEDVDHFVISCIKPCSAAAAIRMFLSINSTSIIKIPIKRLLDDTSFTPIVLHAYSARVARYAANHYTPSM
jgi:ribonuclease HI